MNRIIMLLIMICVCTENLVSQQSGEAYYPETANNAKNIHPIGHRLQWRNPDSTIYNIVYFSNDSLLVASLNPSAILFNGSPSTVYETVVLNSVEPLAWLEKYYWRVVEFYPSINIPRTTWVFTVRQNFLCEYDLFFDNFQNGLSNWTITNDGGNCVWQQLTVFSNAYNLPLTSSGNIIAADSDLCGSGTTTLSTITLNNPVGHQIGYLKIIEFDSDWRIIDSEDKAYVEISSNGGQSWGTVWERIGVDERNSHEVIQVFINGEILVRFRTIQPGWDWWWAIDNVEITQDCPITQFTPPFNLRLSTLLQPSAHVELAWSRGTWVSSTFQIKRKNGLPTDPNPYLTIGQVGSSVTTFTDNTVQENQIYTYQITSNPIWEGGPSNEATAYIAEGFVPVKLISFTAGQENKKIILLWQTATETNNHGFEILRFAQNDNERWEKIGFVPGFGTTTETHQYSFVDESLQTGKYQYRLKQIDLDGSYKYSIVVEVIINAPTEFSLEQNYPNPFNPMTRFGFQIADFGLVTLKIYDVLGNEIATLINEEKSAGEYEIHFDGSTLPSGIYFYQVKTGKFIDTKKMILLK